MEGGRDGGMEGEGLGRDRQAERAERGKEGKQRERQEDHKS